MMGRHSVTPEMEGERPFRCPNCRKLLLLDVRSECEIKLMCHRCKAELTVKLPAPLADALALRAGVLVNQ